MSQRNTTPVKNGNKFNKNNIINVFSNILDQKIKTSDATLSFLHKYTDFVNKALKNVLTSHPLPDGMALIATGGYGRQELMAFSDVDILFLCLTPPKAPDKKTLECIQARFWDTRLKPSCTVRTVEDCMTAITEDLHFHTALLDRRLVAGSKTTFRALHIAFEKHKSSQPASTFITAKLAERDARHRKMGDTRYKLEPNVKEGKGALRDIQTLLWLTNYTYGVKTPEKLAEKKLLTKAEARTLSRAHLFFQTVRCHTQLAAGRADDRLLFAYQPIVAAAMGYKEPSPNIRAEHFMRDYFLMTNEVGHLTRTLCTALEAGALVISGTAGTRKMAQHEDIEGFPLLQNRLTVKNAAQFRTEPADTVRIFRMRQKSGYSIHPNALRYIRNRRKNLKAELPDNKTALSLFLDILTDPKDAEKTLRHMNESGLLGLLIPDFENIVAHMQYDMYHVFTADEHTLRAVGIMHKIESGTLAEEAPLSTTLFKKISNRRVLYLAMFMHDVAKGTGGNHAQKGAQSAKALCKKLGFSPAETETVTWLVENQEFMTLTAYKRDLNDPKTTVDFISAVQSPERLRLLTILTTADIMAVGPDIWNSWKAALLEELYNQALEAMSGTPPADQDDTRFAALQRKTRRLIGPKKKTLDYLVEHAPRYFWISLIPETIADIVTSLDGKEDKTVIHITLHQDFTEVCVHTPDRKGLFALLSGAMAASGASIASAQAFTLTNGMALDIFHVQTNAGHVYENTAYLRRTVKNALAGKIDLADEIQERQKKTPAKSRHFRVPARVMINNDASNSCSVIEVNGKDRIGLLHDIATAMSSEGLQISAARVSTFGSRAVDVFYVKDSYGVKITHPVKIAAVEKTLMNVLKPR